VTGGSARPINEKAAAAVHTPDVSKTAVAKESFALPAGDRSAVVEAGADVDVDRDSISGRRQGHRYNQTENETQASEQGARHGTLRSFAFREISSLKVQEQYSVPVLIDPYQSAKPPFRSRRPTN
jgi:hypothetical protein